VAHHEKRDVTPECRDVGTRGAKQASVVSAVRPEYLRRLGIHDKRASVAVLDDEGAEGRRAEEEDRGRVDRAQDLCEDGRAFVRRGTRREIER
jgi:hypothetical protein